MNASRSPLCRWLAGAAVAAALAVPCSAQTNEIAEPKPATPEPENHPMIVIKTSKGDIKAELYADKAPATVKNFLQYVDAKHYDGTIFHRVINGFMIQGGGFTKDFQQKPTKAPVKNEAANGLKNDRGTLAMARTSDPDSATSQFFINVVNNDGLNRPSPDGYGYCVFGKVVEGMDVVDAIKAVKTTSMGPYRDVPAEAIEIISITQSK